MQKSIKNDKAKPILCTALQYFAFIELWSPNINIICLIKIELNLQSQYIIILLHNHRLFLYFFAIVFVAITIISAIRTINYTKFWVQGILANFPLQKSNLPFYFDPIIFSPRWIEYLKMSGRLLTIMNLKWESEIR